MLEAFIKNNPSLQLYNVSECNLYHYVKLSQILEHAEFGLCGFSINYPHFIFVFSKSTPQYHYHYAYCCVHNPPLNIITEIMQNSKFRPAIIEYVKNSTYNYCNDAGWNKFMALVLGK
jgi:hypothetical protein